MLSGKHHRVNTPRDNAFRANYKENFPNWSLDVYAVQGYDAAQMLDAGLKAVNGDISKKDAMRDAIRTAKIDSPRGERSEEHTSELQSLMRISYAVFCLKKKQPHTN